MRVVSPVSPAGVHELEAWIGGIVNEIVDRPSSRMMLSWIILDLF